MKRPILIILLAFLMCANILAQSLTDGRTSCFDRLTNTYLYSVPEEKFDDGSVQEFTAANPDASFTFLPILKIEGDFGYDYTEGKVTLIMPDGSINDQMAARVKWRGATTNTADKHKRNYHIKFIDANGKKVNRKFFDLRNDNSWLLDAAQVDFSRVRNRVSTDLWNDFATKPYYADKEPKARTGTRGQFVEVFLGDEYRGIYCMTEAIDRSQLKLKKYEDGADPVIHGQLWKSGTYKYAGFFDYGDYDDSSETWGAFEVKYPDIDDVNPTDWSTLYDAIRFVCDSDADTFCNEIDNYIDIPVLIDYVLFCTITLAIDNWGGKNMYWMCYDKQESPKLTLAVWDLDATFGSYVSPANTHKEEFVGPTIEFSHSLNAFQRIDTLNYDDLHYKFMNRYYALRETHFSEESLQKRFDDYMGMLSKSGAYARETARWSGDTDLAGKVLNFDEERLYISDWITKRLKYLDKNLHLFMFPNAINNVTSGNNTSDATYNLCGQRVQPGTKGIVIRGGKKYLQR